MLFVGLAGSAACLTMLFLAMRSVMDVGGACASGGSYEIATPCPKGIGWVMPASIWGGLVFLFLATVAAVRLSLPTLTWLAWPALFLSLGWNFWEFGLDPPGDGGTEWSWIFCGAIFVLMGGTPLVLALAFPQDRPRALRVGRLTSPPLGMRAAVRAADLGVRVRQATTPPPFRAPEPSAAASADGADPDDLVATLERLAALHRDGSLSDDEYAAAKRTMLGGAG